LIHTPWFELVVLVPRGATAEPEIFAALMPNISEILDVR
jgi:hypothetical protein